MKAVIKGWVYLHTHQYIGHEPQFAFFSFQGAHGFTPICEHTIEVELPASFNRIGAESDAIKAELAKVAADYHATVKTLQERLSKLQAIEYTDKA